MGEQHRLSADQARQVAVRAQLLDARPVAGARATDLMDVVHRLTLVQHEPTAAVAPSAELVLWSRLGPSYVPDELAALLSGRQLVELDSMIRPADDVALFRAEMAAWPQPGPRSKELKPWQVQVREWVEANDACRRDVLARLATEGATPQSALPDTCVVPWGSSGWNNNRNVDRLLALMADRGEVAVAGRQERHKLWDLADRVYPDDPVVPLALARRRRDERRLTALGLARARAPVTPSEPNDVGDVGEPAVVEGVPGEWRVDPWILDDLREHPFERRTALLSPFDRLISDRRRMEELFGFDYALEMYKPAAKRQWGYYALPVLHGDRLVGKVDARADRRRGVLHVNAVHEDEPFTSALTSAVEREIADLADCLELAVGPPV